MDDSYKYNYNNNYISIHLKNHKYKENYKNNYINIQTNKQYINVHSNGRWL